MTEVFYVYIHRRGTSDGTVFYVGKGKGKRAWNFTQRSKLWKRVNEKHGTFVQIVATGLEEAASLQKEIELIQWYGRIDMKTGTLVNHTDGGEGTTGHVHTEEYKRNASSRTTGLRSPWHDPKIYTFLNIHSSVKEICKRVEMKQRHPSVHVDSLFSGMRESKGWVVEDIISDDDLFLVKNGCNDRTIWTFYNVDTEETIKSYQAIFRKDNPDVIIESLMSGFPSKRWVVVELVDALTIERIRNNYCGDYSLVADTKEYEFYNMKTAEVFKGTRHAFHKTFNVRLRELFNNKPRGVQEKGWCFLENKDEAMKTTGIDFNVYTFVHKDGQTFTGTRVEFKKEHGFSIKPIFGNTTKSQINGWRRVIDVELLTCNSTEIVL